MDISPKPGPVALVIFGAAGDLTWRKLVPSLYDLLLDRKLPDRFAIIGVDVKPMHLDDFRARLRDGVGTFARRKLDENVWTTFAEHVTDYISADFTDANLYATLRQRLDALDAEWRVRGVRIFYQATPPATVLTLAEMLGQAGLADDQPRARMVFEKPFGIDLISARALNRAILEVFDESQVYRIDHYLGKETVQNILAFRFANGLFEPLWDRRYIDHVQITVAEQVGVGHRGKYYEEAGALRDMVQNHLMQLFCLVAMEPPVSFNADEIRNKKVDVLHAVRGIPTDEVYHVAARGQYAAGWVEGERVPGYREEPGVAAKSVTETFAAVKLHIDNWRWQGVPFYLRTGKRMVSRMSEIVISFRPVPHQPFPARSVDTWQPNTLTLYIQPLEEIQIGFLAKRPGQPWHLIPVHMHFNYCETFRAVAPDAYETLLLDVMLGDMTLFKRADQIEAAWEIVTPILDFWETTPPDHFPNYQAGSWGPESAEVLIARDGHSWSQANVLHADADAQAICTREEAA
jgi:glucose-6-phosphate 1-dehydrogenase